MNRFVGVGRLAKDIELRYTKEGTAVGTSTIAIDRKGKKDEVDFLNFTVWNKTAEIMAQYLKKGSQVAIEGRIQTRNYDGKDGKKVYVTEIVVESFDFVGGKAEASAPAKKDDDLHDAIKQTFGDSVEVEFDESELPF